MAEPMANSEDKYRSSKESTSGAPLLCQIGKMEMQRCFSSDFKGGGPKKPEQHGLEISGKKILEEMFSKLLLGEDMSGCGKGVCTALAISNAITNLCTTVFGQLWRLEPLECEKISMWLQEMEWLLCVSDHIVELVPSWQSLPDGSRFEVMTCRRRSDLHANLPALRKLDHLLLEILDSFTNTDFWYVDQGILVPETDGLSSFHSSVERQEEKWWLPVPCVPPSGLYENSRKQLQQRRDCTNQILKAAMAINNTTLDEMEVPDSYFEALPKNGRACLGDVLYSCIISDQFSPENLLDCIDLSTDFQAIDVANSVEAAIYVWSRKTNMNSTANGDQQFAVKPSWELFKHFIIDPEKKDVFVDRAKTILVWLKQLFPGLPQTNLDMCKIQHNKDVGKSILESYSRVLQSLAFNIVARIDDVLYVDDLNKHSTAPKVSLIAHKSIPYLVPIANPSPAATPSSTTFPLFSPGRSQLADGFVEAKVSPASLPPLE